MAKKNTRYGYGWHYAPKPARKALNQAAGIHLDASAAGSTWWGAQWLEAFNGISDDNRLPRGRAYARNGSVLDVQLNGNEISARVQGSLPRPYQVGIVIPPFTDRQRNDVVKLIGDNPDLLAHLLHGEMPAELADACARKGIHIFPRQWRELNADCSCPDWAMPCKHLAAVLYIVAAEIDKNPFLVFNLHRFDLLEALQASGFTVAETRRVSAAPLSALRRPVPAAPPAWSADLAGLDSLDFSTLPDCRDALLTILADRPAFYPEGDFKAVLKKMYANVAGYAGREMNADQSDRSENEQHGAAFDRAEIVALALNAAGQFQNALVADSAGNLLLETTAFDRLTDWLAGLPAGRLATWPDELRALWLTWRFAESLARHSAFVPQLLAAADGSLLVRWIPALLQQAVRDVFLRWSALLPPGLVQYEDGERTDEPTEADYPQALLAVFLAHYVQGGHGLEYKDQATAVGRLFFQQEAVRFDKFETREYPAVLARWLNRFLIAEKNLVPVLAVEEHESGDFEVSIVVEDKSRPLETPAPLRAVFEQPAFAAVRLELLGDLSSVAEFFPALRGLLASKGREPLRFGPAEFAGVLYQTLPVIRQFGIRMQLPKSLSRILRPQLSLRLTKTGGQVLNNSTVSLQQMLSYQWQVAIGDRQLTPAEFLALMRRSAGLVKLRDEYVFFDEKEMKALADKLARPPALSGGELLQAGLSGEYADAPVAISPEISPLIRELMEIDLIDLPVGLNATLRPYQHRGYSWLRKNARLGFGSVLADDMGLGKTLQVLATLLGLKEDGLLTPARRALVVAPTTLLTNWQREAARFTPGLRTALYHGSSRSLKAVGDADLVFTSYGIARSDAAKLAKQDWLALVIDEAQNIKNPGAEQAKAVKKIAAPVRIAMSGTPVENRLSEYWSVFDFCNKGYLGSLDRFKHDFAIPIEAERDQHSVQRFRKVTQPFVLRRLKTDKNIIDDLPDKVEQNQYCHLTSEQAVLYQHVVERTMSKITHSDGIERRGLVLQLIMALKQICNHPAHYLKKGAPDPALSGKCPLLLDLVQQLLDNDEKALIFTQFREMGELLASMLQTRFGFETPFLHGGVSRHVRDRMVADFQSEPHQRLLLLSLKAGGTGLNLTAASQVIHFDLWWNPAVEAQATDRAFRIGQHRNVLVHRFITSATFEERIDAMIQQKKELAGLTVTSGETWIGELSDRELKELFRLG